MASDNGFNDNFTYNTFSENIEELASEIDTDLINRFESYQGSNSNFDNEQQSQDIRDPGSPDSQKEVSKTPPASELKRDNNHQLPSIQTPQNKIRVLPREMVNGYRSTSLRIRTRNSIKCLIFFNKFKNTMFNKCDWHGKKSGYKGFVE